jgi:hypothetical protein
MYSFPLVAEFDARKVKEKSELYFQFRRPKAAFFLVTKLSHYYSRPASRMKYNVVVNNLWITLNEGKKREAICADALLCGLQGLHAAGMPQQSVFHNFASCKSQVLSRLR